MNPSEIKMCVSMDKGLSERMIDAMAKTKIFNKTVFIRMALQEFVRKTLGEEVTTNAAA